VSRRVAIDTNILLSGLIWPRWPYEILQHALKGDLQLVIPEIVLLETRRQIRRNFPDAQAAFEQFLALVDCEIAPLPHPDDVQAATGLVRQREDIPVALSVIAARVDFFVTYDRDFTDEHATTVRVHTAIPGICLPPIFLRDIMGWTSEQLEIIRHRTWDDLNASR
jgi:predicted nucleic acid-binding protein